ncbi:DUF3426 domain-containing protein [Endothiovibrio diazotrophicus]
MYAQCPACQTVFNISDAQLEAAAGKVRCGSCQETFNAFEHLLDRLPGGAPPRPAAPPPLPEGPEETFDPDLDLASALDTQELMGGLGIGNPTTERAAPTKSTEAPPPGETPAPAKPRSGGRDLGLLWGAGAVVMVLLLPLQFAWLNHQQLALAKPGLRPLLGTLCAISGCTLPPRRDLKALTLVDRQVRSDPTAPGALLLEGVVTNQALFAQPYPTVEVTLSSLSGKPVALRRFTPEEYLAEANPDLTAGLPARGSAPLRLEVADPGDDAVSFTFDFL